MSAAALGVRGWRHIAMPLPMQKGKPKGLADVFMGSGGKMTNDNALKIQSKLNEVVGDATAPSCERPKTINRLGLLHGRRFLRSCQREPR